MNEITGGLTGDADLDIAYLQEQMARYSGHELGKEVSRACGRMMFEIIPDENKEEFSRAVGNTQKAMNAAFGEAKYSIYKKDYDKALDILEAIIKNIESSDMYVNDSLSEYFSFADPFEKVLYEITAQSKKTVHEVAVPFAGIYRTYGSVLAEMRRYEEARAALEKARRWNPMNAQIAFAYGDLLKNAGELDRFYELTKEIFGFAFTSNAVARCYRNLGYFFSAKELYKEAIGCYLMSLEFDQESRSGQTELYNILRKTKGDVFEPTMDELREYGETYGFPIGPDPEVVSLAYALGKRFIDERDFELAEFFLNIAYELTGDPDIRMMIDTLPGKAPASRGGFDDFGGLGAFGGMGAPGAFGAMGGPGGFGSLDGLDSLSGLDGLDGFGGLSGLDGLGVSGGSDAFSGLGGFGALDGLGGFGAFGGLDGLGGMEGMDGMEALKSLDEIGNEGRVVIEGADSGNAGAGGGSDIDESGDPDEVAAAPGGADPGDDDDDDDDDYADLGDIADLAELFGFGGGGFGGSGGSGGDGGGLLS